MTESRSARRERRRERRRKYELRRSLAVDGDPVREAMARVQEIAAEQFADDLCESMGSSDTDSRMHALELLQRPTTITEPPPRNDTYWRCDDCDVVTRPGALAIHQRAKGHEGRTRFE